ncbi:MAG: chorismate synthase [Trueperella sp.]|nr:chorismate synthase [Trueperella sp.]
MIRWSTAGESHGRALIALIEGMPAGIEIDTERISHALWRRRQGHGGGARQAFEADEVTILSGVRHGLTIGSPIAVEIKNSEWAKWEVVMSPDPVDPADLKIDAGTGDEREIARNKPLTRPRPGHADLVGMNKYGFTDARPVLERASARQTAARVVVGELARAFIEQAAGITVVGQVVGIGAVSGVDLPLPTAAQTAQLDASPVRQLDQQLAEKFVTEIEETKKAGDTLGGVIEVVAWDVPQGLGSYAGDHTRLDARIAGALMSIQAVKGVEIGDGFASARRRGSVAHDEIVRDGALRRITNRAGGIEGGMSNGEPIVARIAVKPISTVPHALRTIDTQTGEPASAQHQRSDTTAVIRAVPVAEAMLAIELASAMVEKFGGDSLAEVRQNIASWTAAIPEMQR